jgi:benzodiazapine receptor
MHRYVTLVGFVAIVALVAYVSGQSMPGAWYAGLAKPSWTPPSWVFGPVWSVLYLMIAVAGWLIWQAPGAIAARVSWVAQLALNGAWSPMMFGLHRIDLALAVIVVLWIAIATLIAVSWRPARWAAILLVPYLAWVSYATALNLAIWRLN